MDIHDEIESLINKLGRDYNILEYVYNGKEFIAGKTPVYYSGPYWNNEEVIASIESLLTGKWVSAGEKVKKFEHEFANKINQHFGTMVNSGSSANLVMIAALKKYYGWNDGDEIIVSVVGFPTTISVISQNGLVPVFIDIELDTLNFDVALIEEKISDKTRAIFLSPVLGNPPDIDDILFICEKHNLKLILDCCDSLGTKWKDKYLGEYAVASSHSFYPAHTISTAEGGMITTNIREVSNIAKGISSWGRACFVKGTTIDTVSGIKQIEDIVVGDKVFTHKGNYLDVKSVFNKKYDGDMIAINCGKKVPLVCTADHQILAFQFRDKISEHIKNKEFPKAKDLKITDYLVEKVLLNENTQDKMQWAYSVFDKEKIDSIEISKDLMRLCGYWVAEGNLAKADKGSNGKNENRENRKRIYYKYRVEFTFNKNESGNIEDVALLMKKFFGNKSYYRHTYKNNNGLTMSFNSRKAYEFFLYFFGTMAYNKSLPNFFLTMDKECLAGFLCGFWRGDGSHWDGAQKTENKKARRCSYNFCTTSEKLYEQIRKILLRFEINPVTYIRVPEKHQSSIINGTIVQARRNLYSIILYGKNAYHMLDIIQESNDNISQKNHYFFSPNGQYAIFPIRSITQEFVENIDVFNLEVSQDNSYHANGLSVHNCVCSGVENLLPNGICNHRFDKWLDNYDGVVDHKYVFNYMGYNLKPLDLQGSIGLVQLTKLDEIMSKRKSSKKEIEAIIGKYVNGIGFPQSLDQADVVWFGTPIICKSKDQKQKLVTFLEKNKIQTRNYFAGNILLHPGYSHLDDYKNYPNANQVLDRVFFLGASPHYDSKIFEYIEDIMKGFIDG